MLSFLKRLVPKFIKNRIASYFKNKYATKSFCRYDLNIQHDGRLNGKSALVTGGTGAIGSAICFRLALEGANVGICGRSEEKITKIIDNIKNSFPKASLHPIILDVNDYNCIENAIKSFVNIVGEIDFLINNAGGGARSNAKPLREQEISVIDEILSTNLRGTLLCSKEASKYMVKQMKGKIISMSSVMGLNGKENWSEYSSTKAGIIGLTKSLALELGEFNITVNSVCPGMVNQVPFDRALPLKHTQTNALKRFGYTDEVASLVAFLCSDEANYITGQNFIIDGGRTIGLKNN